MNQRDDLKVWDFLPQLVSALTEQLKQDDRRWGKTWLRRPRSGQEERTIKTINDYFDQYTQRGRPIPWLKVIGNSMICWIREQHPDLWPE